MRKFDGVTMKTLKRVFVIVGWLVVSSLAMLLFAQEVKEQKSTSEVVLIEEDFVKNNCENVGDALKTITGVYVSSTGAISLRDVSSSKVVVILDGQRLNTAGGMGVNVSDMPIDNIEKIELLRGGRSAQYGADAIGGVIRITTKSKKQTSRPYSFGMKTTQGSYDRQIFNLSNTFNYRWLNTFLSYQRETWEGDYKYHKYIESDYPIYADTINTLGNNQQSSYNIFFKAGLNFLNNQNLSFSTNLYKANNNSPGMVLNPTPRARLKYDNRSYNLAYDKKALFKNFSLKAQTYFLDNETKFDDPDNPNFPPSDHDNYAVGVELSQAGTLFDIFNLGYGYSFRNDRIVSTEVGKEKRDTQSAHTSLSAVMNLGSFISQIEASVALRYDSHSDFDKVFSPRFSLSANHSGNFNLAMIAHITRSYKAPSFNDLYWPQDNFAVGNPDLRPEYGYNYDIGFTFGITGISATVNYFRNDIENLIIWQQDKEIDGKLYWTPSNLSETSTNGIETSATIDLLKKKLSMNAEYTFMKALDVGPDPNKHNKYIIYRPKNKLDLTGTIRVLTMELNLIYHYVGLRYTKPANTQYLPEYRTIDSNVTYRFNMIDINWVATLEISNITDEIFMKVTGTAEPGRMYKISLGVNL